MAWIVSTLQDSKRIHVRDRHRAEANLDLVLPSLSSPTKKYFLCKDLSSSKSLRGCTEKDEENAAVRDAYEAVPVVHCTALQLLRRNMELLQQGRNH